MTCPTTATKVIKTFFEPAQCIFKESYLNKNRLRELKEKGLSIKQRRDYVKKGYRTLFSQARTGYYSMFLGAGAGTYLFIVPTLESLLISTAGILSSLPLIKEGYISRTNFWQWACGKIFKTPNIKEYKF